MNGNTIVYFYLHVLALKHTRSKTIILICRSVEVFRESCKEKQPAMFGLLISGARPLHERTHDTTDKEMKWIVPQYMYNHLYYPPYLHGAGKQ